MNQRHSNLQIVGWQTTLYIYVGGKKAEAQNHYARAMDMSPDADPDEVDDTDGAFFAAPGGVDCGIWIPGPPNTPHEIGNVAHEAVHAANHVLMRRGVAFDQHKDADGHTWMNDEPWAYLVAAVTEGILEFANAVR